MACLFCFTTSLRHNLFPTSLYYIYTDIFLKLEKNPPLNLYLQHQRTQLKNTLSAFFFVFFFFFVLFLNLFIFPPRRTWWSNKGKHKPVKQKSWLFCFPVLPLPKALLLWRKGERISNTSLCNVQQGCLEGFRVSCSIQNSIEWLSFMVSTTKLMF